MMQCLLLVEPDLQNVAVNVGTSDDPSCQRVYAILPIECEHHPFYEVLKQNGVEVMKSTHVNSPIPTRLEVLEIFVTFRLNALYLYVDEHNYNFVAQLFSSGCDFRIKVECWVRRWGSPGILSEIITTHYAVVEEENLKILQKLLVTGTNITYRHPKVGTLLHFAACKNYFYIHFLKLVLECGTNVNARSVDGATPLHVAVMHNRLRNATLLLDSGADVNAKSDDGSSPLHIAAKYGVIHSVNLLLKRGAQVDAKMEDLSTPLHKSIEVGSVSIWPLIVKGADINAKTKDGLTPLHTAVQLGAKFIAHVKYLLRNGADVHATDVNGATPLFFCFEKWPLLVPLLVGYGADINAETSDNETILTKAVTRVFPYIFDYILSLNPSLNVAGNKKAFQVALSSDEYPMYARVVEKMIRYGFNVDAGDVNTPDMFFGAISKQRLDIVEKLIGFGANVNQHHIFMEQSLTPLHLAVQRNNVNIVQLLLDNGADVRAQCDRKERTPISDAVECGSIEMVQILVAKGGKVREEVNLLHLAAEKATPDVIQFLLEEGCDLNNLDEKGRTPFMIASHNCKIEAMELMIRFGAEVDFTKLSVKVASSLTTLKAFLDYCFACLTPVAEATIRKYFSKRISSGFNLGDCYDMLARHLVKMEAVNFCCASDFISSRLFENFRLSCFKRECEAELKAIKVKRVTSAVTYYDVLLGDPAQIVCYARNGSFARILEASDVRGEYPIYGSILRCKFRAGSLRRKLLQLGIKVLSRFSPRFLALPYDLKEIIVNRLSNQDIFILRKCLLAK